MEKKNQENIPQGTGRISNINGTEKNPDNRDISCIDQQEGEMHHGETGGNFQPASDEAAKREE